MGEVGDQEHREKYLKAAVQISDTVEVNRSTPNLAQRALNLAKSILRRNKQVGFVDHKGGFLIVDKPEEEKK
ncbi:MAG: hypothetical protein ACHQUA_00270 [Microgenomates group bacterium]